MKPSLLDWIIAYDHNFRVRADYLRELLDKGDIHMHTYDFYCGMWFAYLDVITSFSSLIKISKDPKHEAFTPNTQSSTTDCDH